MLLPQSTVSPVHSTTKHTQLFLSLELQVPRTEIIFTLLAKLEVFYFGSDKDPVSLLGQLTNCSNWSATDIQSVSSADICESILKHTEIYSNALTVQIIILVKYLPCYSKLLIYINAVHTVVSRTALYLNKQSITVPVSVTQMDTKEGNIGRKTIWEIMGNRGQ